MDAKLKLLLNASAKIAEERDIQKILLHLMEVTKDLLDADRASIFIHDVDTKELWTTVATGVKEIRIPEKKGIAGFVWESGNILNIPDAYQDSRFDQEVDKITGYRTKTILAYPLYNSKGDAIGVFQVINKKGLVNFNEEDITLLQHLSLFVSSNIENTILNDKLKKSSEEVIYRLSYATKFKDPETQSHIIRVGLYSEEMARQLGWKSHELELIKLASPMHDIGKVGIPDRVLQKPGKLDSEEWNIMQKHSQYGYDILKGGDSPLMQMAAIVALDHHEKWDGSGYPNKKKGEEISIYGRLTTISDVFDALTSKRCYKEPWSYERTCGLLKEESGRHFDPKLVEIFLDKIDTMIQIKTLHMDEE